MHSGCHAAAGATLQAGPGRARARRHRPGRQEPPAAAGRGHEDPRQGGEPGDQAE